MSIDNEDTIEILYGEQKEDDTPEPSTPETPEAVEVLYPEDEKTEVTGNPYALPEDKNTVEDELYGGESKVQLSGETDLSIIAKTDAEKEMLSSNLSYMASTVGASQLDVESLVETCNQQVITNAQHEPDAVMADLYEQHGKDLPVKLQAAQRLISSFPQLSAWLDSTGGGDNPKIINQIMKIAQSPRAEQRIETLLRKK